MASAVQMILRTLSGRRSDALVVVTGDHTTLPNSTRHSPDAVPIMLYGGTARAAAERALKTLTAAAVMKVPKIAAVDFPLLFPFFPG